MFCTFLLTDNNPFYKRPQALQKKKIVNDFGEYRKNAISILILPCHQCLIYLNDSGDRLAIMDAFLSIPPIPKRCGIMQWLLK